MKFGAMCPEARAGFEGATIRLEGPPALMQFVAEVIDFADTRGLSDLADTLLMLYGESMPFALSLQLGGLELRCPWLFSTPLPLAAMPGLNAALTQLDQALTSAMRARDLRVDRPFVWQRWLDGAPLTLAEVHAETFFGGLQPLFGTSPEVLDELAAVAQPERPAAIDRVLGAALLHEFLHFGRNRDALMPPYLDEAIAGSLGAWLDPRTALPEDPDSEALEGFATFAQVGLALSDLIGRDPLLLAQAGYLSWDDALPTDLRAAILRLYWQKFAIAPAAHLHPDPDDVLPWADLFVTCGPTLTFDRSALRNRLTNAVAAFGLTRSRPGRVKRGPTPPVVLDFDRGLAWAESPQVGAPKNHLIPRLPTGNRSLPATDGFSGLDLAIDNLLADLPLAPKPLDHPSQPSPNKDTP